jgi:hypothetical protein
LLRWFKDIDQSGSGVISQRELIVALREKKELLAMLSRASDLGGQDSTPLCPRMSLQIRSEEAALRRRVQSHGEEQGSAQLAPGLGAHASTDLEKGQAVATAHEKRQEIYRIKQILRDVDTDNSGTMEWNEFVDFFRRAGFLLEYREDEHRNRTAVALEHEAHMLRQRLRGQPCDLESDDPQSPQGEGDLKENRWPYGKGGWDCAVTDGEAVVTTGRSEGGLLDSPEFE